MRCEDCIHEKVCEGYSNCEEVGLFEPKRPHGEWVEVPKYKGFYACSKCLERLGGDFWAFDHWEMRKENFCPVCGSDNRKRGEAE